MEVCYLATSYSYPTNGHTNESLNSIQSLYIHYEALLGYEKMFCCNGAFTIEDFFGTESLNSIHSQSLHILGNINRICKKYFVEREHPPLRIF